MQGYPLLYDDELEVLLSSYVSDFPMVCQSMRHLYSYTVNNWLTNTKRQLAGHDAAYWQNYENVLKEILEVTQWEFSELMKVVHFQDPLQNIQGEDFDAIRRGFYDFFENPVKEHFYFAYFPGAFWRRNFVKQQVSAIRLEKAKLCEVGFGPGVLLVEALSQKPDWEGYGIDISNACVEYAQRYAKLKQITTLVNLSQGDILNIPYEAETFDVVMAMEVLEHIPEPEAGFSEICRILRNEGYLISSIPVQLPIKTHLHLFQTESEVVQMHERTGFAVEVFESQPFPYTSGKMFTATFLVSRKKASRSIPEREEPHRKGGETS